MPSPSASSGAEQMEQRIASRLFPGLSDERVGRATPHYVAHYRVLRKLGRGGMGVVYAAEDQKLGRVVAIKLLHRRELSERGRQRLMDEARTLAKLSHPNVVHVYEVGEQAQDLFIAMEFIEGETLAKWQRERRQRTELLGAYLQAGAGLVAAHRSGIIHCDFKPANVLVGRDGRVRVVDFGLAREDESASTDRIRVAGYGSNSIAQVAGTPGYAAPELFIGRPVSASISNGRTPLSASQSATQKLN
ncbi:MAG TPA: serine/threonine-protein kinase [Enhygromyxa sp.]|nr:serine/threonine-protein kinase [Enhygromyxa sp.]